MPAKAIRLSVLLLCGLIAGCSVVDFVKPAGPPSNEQIYAVYQQMILKQSTSADVLMLLGNPEYGLLSQSKSIIAQAGQKKKGYKSWLNMVAFDENSLIANRKYVFIADERPRQLFVEPWEGVDFDCQMVLPKEVLDEPYANENARRIAILKQVGAETRKDTKEVGADNAVIARCGMIVGQAIDTVGVKLNGSPAMAAGLSEPDGLEFEHISFDKGRLRMIVEDDVVTVKMRLGSYAKKWKVSLEKPVEAD
ncbi:MAG: hypothetical protein ABII09_00755 [Planctomycetota bacterium]